MVTLRQAPPAPAPAQPAEVPLNAGARAGAEAPTASPLAARGAPVQRVIVLHDHVGGRPRTPTAPSRLPLPDSAAAAPTAAAPEALVTLVLPGTPVETPRLPALPDCLGARMVTARLVCELPQAAGSRSPSAQPAYLGAVAAAELAAAAAAHGCAAVTPGAGGLLACGPFLVPAPTVRALQGPGCAWQCAQRAPACGGAPGARPGPGGGGGC